MDDPHAEVEIKLQLKPRGSVAKEEDPKPSHQLYKLQIKSTRSNYADSVYGMYKRSLRAPTRGNAQKSSDSCGHWRQEHTGVGPG